MARRNRDTDELERDDTPIANLLAPAPVPGPVLSPTTWRVAMDPLTEIEDRRTFHPESVYRDALATSGLPATSKPIQRPTPTFDTRYAFDAPREVAICVRRKTRREVIFAKRKAGKGARARRRRNYWSNVKC